MSKLVGTIRSLRGSGIRTRFFYVNENGHQDVTLELCRAIENFNTNAEEIRKNGDYSLIIPITYKNGLADYSFGCGLTHYLQESEFNKLSRYVETFPLDECRLSVFTPEDVKHILNSNADDVGLGEKLVNYYY